MGVLSIAALQESVHSRYLLMLSIYRLIQSCAFEEAYDASTDVQKQVAVSLIDDLNKRGLNEWVRSQLKIYNLYEILPMKELRQFGQELNITNYSRLTRLELINSINKYQKVEYERDNGYERNKKSTNCFITQRNGTTFAESRSE
jgi:hypothetical protein